MQASCEHRFLLMHSHCRRIHESPALCIIGGTIALLTPRFVGAGSFSAPSFGNTSVVLDLICLIAVLISHQMPQRLQAPNEIDKSSSDASFRPYELISHIFLCASGLFTLFEFIAFATAVNGGYDPSRSWIGSPARAIEQTLAAILLFSFCLYLSHRSHTASVENAYPCNSHSPQTKAFFGLTLFLAGACMTGLPSLSSFTSFGSLFDPTFACLFAATTCAAIAFLTSFLLWRSSVHSTSSAILSLFFCGSVLVHLAQRIITSLPLQFFNYPFHFIALSSVAVIVILTICLRSKYVGGQQPSSSSFTSDTKEPHSALPFDKLSNREQQVLRLSAEGHTSRSIARELEIAPSTISTYKSRISKKLHSDWQTIIDECCIDVKKNGPDSNEVEDTFLAQREKSGRPSVGHIIPPLAGLLLTLSLHALQPISTYVELLVITLLLFSFVFSFHVENNSVPTAREASFHRLLLPSVSSVLVALLVALIPDGRMAALSLNQNLLLFLVIWCPISLLLHCKRCRADSIRGTKTFDENRARCYFKLKGIKGIYLEVALMTLKGSPASEIAHALSISISTVTSYRARIYAKLRVRGKEGLVTLLESELV